HQQINEYRREQETDTEIYERTVHALDLTDHLDRVAGLELLLHVDDDLVDLAGDAAEIEALSTGIDLVYRLHIGLVSVGGYATALEGRDVAEQIRHGHLGC